MNWIPYSVGSYIDGDPHPQVRKAFWYLDFPRLIHEILSQHMQALDKDNVMERIQQNPMAPQNFPGSWFNQDKTSEANGRQ